VAAGEAPLQVAGAVQYALVTGVALFVSALTLFSGFGLGALLMPAFALFLPTVPVAVAATAVVHLANNLFKLALVGRKADGTAVVRFALPAAGPRRNPGAAAARVVGQRPPRVPHMRSRAPAK